MVQAKQPPQSSQILEAKTFMIARAAKHAFAQTSGDYPQALAQMLRKFRIKYQRFDMNVTSTHFICFDSLLVQVFSAPNISQETIKLFQQMLKENQLKGGIIISHNAKGLKFQQVFKPTEHRL